MKRGPEHKKF